MKWFRINLASCLAILLVLAASSVFASYLYYAKQSAQLEVATHNLHRCQEVAARIVELRNSPHRARLETRSPDDLGSVVEKAAAAAQLPRERVLRIDPQTGKRLGKTDYLQQDTEVELMAVTLRQVVDLIFNVTRSDEQLQVSTLRLRVPHDAETSAQPELWLADVILTQRIYSPAKEQRK